MTILADFSNRRNPPADAAEAADHFGISSIPVSILLTPDGEEVDRFVGALGADDLIARLNAVSSEHSRDPIMHASLDAAVEAVRSGRGNATRIAVLAGPDSEFGRDLEDTLLAEDLRGAVSHYVWVREVREEGGHELVIRESDDDRTVVASRDLRRERNQTAMDVMRMALSGPDR